MDLKSLCIGKFLTVGDLLDCCDTDHTWLPSQVLAERSDSLFIHYLGWQSKYNEWISRYSPRLARFRTYTKPKFESQLEVQPEKKNSLENKASHPENKSLEISDSPIKFELKHPSFSDIVIKTKDGKKLQFHRLLLTQKSKFFSELLEGDPFTREISLDYNADILEVLLQYIQEPFTHEKLVVSFKPTFILNLAFIAHQYNVESLEKACDSVVVTYVKNMDIPSVIKAWLRARQLNLREAEKECFIHLLRNHTEILKHIPKNSEEYRVLLDALLWKLGLTE